VGGSPKIRGLGQGSGVQPHTLGIPHPLVLHRSTLDRKSWINYRPRNQKWQNSENSLSLSSGKAWLLYKFSMFWKYCTLVTFFWTLNTSCETSWPESQIYKSQNTKQWDQFPSGFYLGKLLDQVLIPTQCFPTAVKRLEKVMHFQDQNWEVSIGHEWAFSFLGSRLESQLQNFLRWTLMLLVFYYKGEAYQADESGYLLCLIMSFHLLLESQSGIFWAEQWWHSCCHNPPAAECLGTGSSQEAPHTRMRLIWPVVTN
jgi:hypothetical protein